MTLPNLTWKSWVAAGGLGLLILFMLVGKASPNKVQTEAPVQAASTQDIAKTNEMITSLTQSAERAKQTEATKVNTPARVPAEVQNPLLAQQQQMLAQLAYQRALFASNPTRQQEQRETSPEGEKSFVLSYKDEDNVTPKGENQPIHVTEPVAPKDEPAGGFACGSEEEYWSGCIPEGSVIMAVTTNVLRGDFTGPVMAKVSQPLMSLDKKHVLVPAGTVVLGESGRVEGQDQARLVIGFHRMILSEGSDYHRAGWAVSLDKLQGLSVDGSAGQKGKVNRHLGSTIAAAAAYGLLAGFSMSGTGSYLTNDGVDVYRQGFSQAMGQQGQQTLSRMLNRMPTITVPVGSECDVYIASDLRMRQ